MSFTIAFLPVYKNPYQHLLTAELETLGIHVEHLDVLPTAAWLARERDRVRVLHLHWLYGLYMKHFWTPLRLGSFLWRLALAKHLGYSIVWTVHNILPHRQPFPPMHRFVRRFVMQRANAVITHCQYGRQEIMRLFPSDVPVYIIPHGNYAGVHPVTVTRAQARSSLGIGEQSFVYLLLGNISSYKGIESFVVAFQQDATKEDVAIIAGRNRAPELVQRLEALAECDSRFRLFVGFIPDEAMQLYLQAADVAVFCFREVLTSGSVILAMSYGLPVIVPDRGCLPELVTPEAGLLYDPADPGALHDALRTIKNTDTAQMGAEAKRIAESCRWDEIARQTAAVYRDCLG